MSKFFIPILVLFMLSASSAFAQQSQSGASVNLIVSDKAGNPISDLRKDEISLLTDGKPQAIISLEKQQSPLIYALALDSSSSLKPIFRDIQSAAGSIVAQGRAGDEVLLISFIGSGQIYAPQNFSSDKNLLTKTIDNFVVEGGQSAVIDAIYLAVQKVGEYKKADKTRPRAVIVITDGEDRDSYYKERQLLELIKSEKVPVFIVGLVYGLDAGEQFSVTSRRRTAMNFIEKVAGKSGGAAFFSSNPAEAAGRVRSLLQSQYVVGYSPTATGDKSKSSEIEIKLAKDSTRKDVKFYVH